MEKFVHRTRGPAVVVVDDDDDEEEEVVPVPKRTKTTTTTTPVPDVYFAPKAVAPTALKKEHQLWADKYAPQTYDDLVGLGTIVSKLEEWLKRWDDIHLSHKTKSNPATAFKAVLLSGPPGIGKSTTARLVANKLHRHIFELNASDARSKKLIEEKLQDVVQVGTIHFSATTTTTTNHHGSGRVVIMDEVDGMSSSDRGGIQELIKLIKVSKCPIICICNDHSKASIRTLTNYCLDLKFQRPQLPSVMKRMKEVCKRQGLVLPDDQLENLIKSSGNDIRQVLNALQLFASSTKSTTAAAAVDSKDAILRLNGFDAVRFIFCESHSSSLSKRNEAFFSDYDLIPLMVAQNYIGAVQNSSFYRDEMDKIAVLSAAADAVCDADMMSKMVRQDQRWDLLTNMAMMNLRVAHVCHGSIGFPGFPEWLGKNSNASKRQRMLQELSLHMKTSGTMVNKQSLRLDYLTYMRSLFLTPFLCGDVNHVIALLDEYGMNRDDLLETVSELQFPQSPHFPDLFAAIPSLIKSNFTREYNKRSHKNQLLVSEEQANMVTKRSRKKSRVAAVGDDLEGEEEDDNEEEEEEVNLDAFRKKASAKKSAAKKPASAASKKPSTTKKKQ